MNIAVHVGHVPHHGYRKNLRIPGFDYSMPGAYFVTICSRNRECLFGEVVCDEMKLNSVGSMVVMPNHFHAILRIVGAPLAGAPASTIAGSSPGAGARPAPTVGNIVGVFKSLSSSKYLQYIKKSGNASICGILWQRNYYEHVIRNEKLLEKIREYILHNPARWEDDPERP
ncbi:MAG TPA: transposase [bacterium]|nr:transposase [bacterium]